jgi:hypothetical protein
MIRWTFPLLLTTVVVVVMTTTTTMAKKTILSTHPPFDLLTREIMEISLIAAQLASLARANDTAYATGFDATRNISTHAHPDYESIQFYNEEPDQAVLARKGGRCYVAFRYVALVLLVVLQLTAHALLVFSWGWWLVSLIAVRACPHVTCTCNGPLSSSRMRKEHDHDKRRLGAKSQHKFARHLQGRRRNEQ